MSNITNKERSARNRDKLARQYLIRREKIGTQEKVASMLGLDRATMRRRESGLCRVTNEMMIALAAIIGETN